MSDVFGRLWNIRDRSNELKKNVTLQKVVVTTDVADLCDIIDDLVSTLQDALNQVAVE